MDSGTWVAIYLPLLVILITSSQYGHIQQLLIRKRMRHQRKKNGGWVTVTNELLKQSIGKHCKISTGSYGTTITGKMTDISENWVAVETRKGTELVNAEFIQNIKILPG